MKNNKKGFTLVELVIVIAVIAILAAVLLPTFSGIITNSRASSAMQQANAAFKNYVSAAYSGSDAKVLTNSELKGVAVVAKVNGKFYVYNVDQEGKLVETADRAVDAVTVVAAASPKLASFNNGAVEIFEDDLVLSTTVKENLKRQVTADGDTYTAVFNNGTRIPLVP